MAYQLRFYEKRNGLCPVRKYLRVQNKATRGEAGWLLICLEKEGDKLERPIADFLEKGIYELRVIVERNQHRILYFFHKKIIIATNAFLKKTKKVPKNEIKKAMEYREDWLKREEEKR